jgi:long-chain acyl-CoA synthetase
MTRTALDQPPLAVPAANLPSNWPVLSIAQAHAALTAPGQMFEMEEIEQRGRTVRAWKNGPKSLVDLWSVAATYASRTFLVYEDERVTYDAFRRAAFAFAGALLARGVTKGDRVALVMLNQSEWPVCFYGAALAGAIVSPLNAWWTADEIAFALKDSGASVAIFDEDRFARVRAIIGSCDSVHTIIVSRFADTLPPVATSLESLIGPSRDWAGLPEAGAPPVAIDPEDRATLFYTSGTSGVPKGAVASHRAVTTPVFVTLLSQIRSFLRRGEAPPATGPAAEQKRQLVSIPMFHVTGCFSALDISIAIGAMIVIMRKWDAEAALALIERERINSVGGVPTIAWQLLEHPARAKYDLSSIDSVSYGGAPAAAELVRRLNSEFPKAGAGCGWGMTETCATFTHHFGEDYTARPDSCGPATPVADMKVVDEHGATLPPGAIGELLVRGPHVVEGYWNRPTETQATFVDGWLRTGDLARIDDEGFCTIVDRAKDVIIRGGENIYSAEVENVLYRHPAIMDAALVPMPHKTLGEEAGAVVTLKPGAKADEDELKAFVARHLAPFKIPARVLLRNEPLPRNANGKIMKAALRPLFDAPAPNPEGRTR